MISLTCDALCSLFRTHWDKVRPRTHHHHLCFSLGHTETRSGPTLTTTTLLDASRTWITGALHLGAILTAVWVLKREVGRKTYPSVLTAPTQPSVRTIRDNVFLQYFPEKDFRVLLHTELQISPAEQEWLSPHPKLEKRHGLIGPGYKEVWDTRKSLSSALATGEESATSIHRQPVGTKGVNRPGNCTLLSQRWSWVSSQMSQGPRGIRRWAGDKEYHSLLPRPVPGRHHHSPAQLYLVLVVRNPRL